ncbi:MAG: cell division protein FtsB [Pseudomonadales bacterium]
MADKLISAFLLLTLVGLQYRLWVGEGSLAHVQRLKSEIVQQRGVNDQLRTRNERMEREVVSLKDDPAAIEERARRELGMIKNGEMFYVFIEESDAAKDLR